MDTPSLCLLTIQNWEVQTGKATIYCDNKGAITNSFKHIIPSITPFLSPSYDLLLLAQQLVARIPITVLGEWVKGHYSGKDRKIQHDSNDRADVLAGEHLKAQSPQTGTNMSITPYPGYRIRLLKDNCVLSSKYSSIISQSHHDTCLQECILKCTKWSWRDFHKVNWEAHGTAFNRITGHQQITLAKLIHNLANTNRQNFLYYKSSPLCPGCKAEDETFEHVLRCPLPQTEVYRQQQIAELQIQLFNLQTPQPVIQTIIQGFHHWVATPPGHSHAPTYGSLFCPDMILTGAYFEQFNQLGLFQVCLGRISKLWSRAVSSYHASTSPVFDTDRWATSFISLLWKFTRKMWNYRNQIVHGATVDEAVSTQMSLLHEKVTSLYNKYTENPSYVLPRHEYLFTQRTLQYRLQMSYDSINCWLRSVEEARNILEFQERHLQETAATFFRLFRSSASTSDQASNSDFSYSPSMTPSITSHSLARTGSTDSLTVWTSSSSIDDSIDDSSSCNTITSTDILNPDLDKEPKLVHRETLSGNILSLESGIDCLFSFYKCLTHVKKS